jgi:mannose-6-phosphate isomerase-like protein (cupin superfamily)
MLPIRWVSRDEMLLSYVARYKDLKGSRHGLPDSEIAGHHKYIANVFGFDPPKGANAVNPVGNETPALIHPKAGFSIGFLKAKPHNGPVLHNHDTNETFIPLAGTWRFTWEASPAHMETVDLDPYDTVSFPPGVPRAFENLTPAPGDDQGFLLAVVGGDSPVSMAMPGVQDILTRVAKGDLPTMKDDPHKSILITTKDGGFGG